MTNKIFLVLIILMPIQIASCSAYPENNSVHRTMSQTYYFSAMYSPTPMIIELDRAGHGQWQMSFDSGNSAENCAGKQFAFCLLLTDLWTFAVPAEIDEESHIGSSWTYRETRFSLDEKLYFDLDHRTDVILLISATNGSTRTVFHYHAAKGILAFFTASAPGPDFDEDGLPFDLWLSDAILR